MSPSIKDRLTTVLGLAVGVKQFLGVDYAKLGSGDGGEIGKLIVGVVAILIGIALYNPSLVKKVRRG